VLFEVGRTYYAIGNYGKAIEHLKQVLEAHSDNRDASLLLAKCYIALRDYSLALQELEKTHSIHPQDADVLFEVGRTYYAIGNYGKAIEHLKQVLEAHSDNRNANLLLAKCYIALNDYHLALEELKKSCRINPTGEAYCELGAAYEALGYYRSSVEAFKKAIELGADIKNVHFQLGRAYREIGEYELSINEFKKLQMLHPYKESAFYKNKLLNEIEISQRKFILESKPMVLGVALTHNCNIRCRMCRYWRDPWDVPEVVIKEIMELLPYLKDVYWQGGEPFFSKYFQDLFDKASTFETLSQTVVTNGILLTEQWAKKLVKSNINIIWSIDSTNKHMYEFIREGSRFEKLIDCINIVNHYRNESTRDKSISPNFRIIMQSTIMKYNYREVEELIDFAQTYRFDGINLIPIRYVTGDENIFYHNDQEAMNYLKTALPRILNNYQRQGFRIFNQLPVACENSDSGPQNIVKQELNEKTNGSQKNAASDCLMKDKKMLCYWPWKSLYILYKGTVRPYGFCESNVGDVNLDLLSTIWNGQAMQEYRKRVLENTDLEKCSTRCTSGIMPKDALKSN
jgi:MoaA/NifB/PqqE/SkfB family radical SAM enzyme/Tfp pilus assembly protein PilF